MNLSRVTSPPRKQWTSARSAAALTKVPVSDADLSSLYRLGDGGLSPLTGADGPGRRSTAFSTRKSSSTTARSTPGRFPMSFPVDETLAEDAEAGRDGGLVNGKDDVVGTLDDQRRFPLGQGRVRQERLRHGAHRSSRRPHGRRTIRATCCWAARCGCCRSRSIRSTASSSCRRARRGPCSARRAGSASSPSRRAIRCTGPTNTPWSPAWNG